MEFFDMLVGNQGFRRNNLMGGFNMPQNIGIGGGFINQPSLPEGLLGEQATEDLRKRSIGSGLLNAIIGYAAMPKNENLGLGRILAGAAQQGLAGARGVYDQAGQDLFMQQRLEEMKRTQAKAAREDERQVAQDLFRSNIGKPNATRDVFTQDAMQVPVAQGEGAPSFATQLPAPTVTQEQFYDPNVMLQQALQTGALDLKDYLTLSAKKKQGTKLLSNTDLEEIKATGVELPTDRGQRYQRDLDTGKVDLIQGTLQPEKPSFKIGDLQKIEGFNNSDKDIQREYVGDGKWKIVGIVERASDGLEFLNEAATAKAAAIYNESGTLPPIARSKAGQNTIKNIMNAAALMDTGKSPQEAAMAVLRNKQNRAAEQQALKRFSGGIEGVAVRSMNTATDHLFTLEEAGLALKNNDIRAFNAISNRIKKEIGVSAPVSFDGVKKIVAGEIVKATTGTAGALGDREEVSESILAANSPEQLLEQIGYYKKLMAGQLQSLELQFITGTNRGSSEFRRRLSPKTKTILAPAVDENEAFQSSSAQVASQPSGSLTMDAVQQELARRKGNR